MLQRVKRIFIFSVTGLLLLLGATAAGIQFTDWTRYKPAILGQINRTLTNSGKPNLSIEGDLEVKLFPAPRLVVGDFKFGNITGGVSSHMLRGQELELVSSWSALLSGDLGVQSLKLNETEVLVEIGLDGQTNFEQLILDFGNHRSPAAEQTPTSEKIEETALDAESDNQSNAKATEASKGNSNAATNVEFGLLESFLQNFQHVDFIELERVRVACQDLVRSGTSCFGRQGFAIADLNGSLKVESDSSYFATLTGISQGADLEAEIRVANIVSGAPAAVEFRLKGGESMLSFTGVYDRLASPFLDGNLTLEANHLDPAFLEGLFGQGADEAISVEILMPASLKGTLIASDTGLYEIENLEGRFDSTHLSGHLAFDNVTGALSGTVAFDHLNLDALIESQPSREHMFRESELSEETEAAIEIEENGTDSVLTQKSQTTTPLHSVKSRRAWLTSWSFSGDIHALDVGGETLEAVRFEASRKDIDSGAAALFTQIDRFDISAPLPWGGGLVLNGVADFSKLQTEFDIGYGIRFEDGAKGLAWLGLDDLPVRIGNQKGLESTGRLTGTQTYFQILQANLKADQLDINGAMQISKFEDHHEIYIQAETDNIVFDDWLPDNVQDEVSNLLPASSSSLTAALGALPLALSKVSASLDGKTAHVTELNLKAKTVGYGNQTYSGVRLLGRIDKQGITLNEFEAVDQAGVKTSLAGFISKTLGEDIGLRGDVTAPSFGAFLDSLGTRPSGAMWARGNALTKTGPMSLSWIHRGHQKQLSESGQDNIEVAFQSGDIRLDLKGTLPMSDLTDDKTQTKNCVFRARLTHRSAQQLYEQISAPYPLTPPDSPLNLTGQVEGCDGDILLSNLSGEVGEHSISGKVSLGAEMQTLSGHVVFDELNLDEWLPDSPVYSHLPTPFAPIPITRNGDLRSWSQVKLSDTWLSNTAGRWTLHAATLRRGDLTLTDAAFDISIEDEEMSVESCSGRLYGGTYTCGYTQKADGALTYALELRDAELGDHLIGLPGVDVAHSRITLDLSIQTKGDTELERIAALQARGKMSAQGGALVGMNFAPLTESYTAHGSNAAEVAQSYKAALSSGETPLDTLALSFNVEAGVFASRDLVIKTATETNMTARYALRYDLQTGELDTLGDIEGSGELQRVSLRHVGKIGSSSIHVDDQALAEQINEVEFQKLQNDLTTDEGTASDATQGPNIPNTDSGGSIGDILKDVLQGN